MVWGAMRLLLATEAFPVCAVATSPGFSQTRRLPAISPKGDRSLRPLPWRWQSITSSPHPPGIQWSRRAESTPSRQPAFSFFRPRFSECLGISAHHQLLPPTVHEEVSLPCGFREVVTSTGSEDPIGRCLELDAVAGRHVDGFHPGSGSQGGPGGSSRRDWLSASGADSKLFPCRTDFA